MVKSFIKQEKIKHDNDSPFGSQEWLIYSSQNGLISFFETGIGVIILTLHFSFDLKQLPSPHSPPPPAQPRKQQQQKFVPTEVTLSKPAVGHFCRIQSRVMSGLSTNLSTAVVGQPTRNKVKKKKKKKINLEFLWERDLSVY